MTFAPAAAAKNIKNAAAKTLKGFNAAAFAAAATKAVAAATKAAAAATKAVAAVSTGICCSGSEQKTK